MIDPFGGPFNPLFPLSGISECKLSALPLLNREDRGFPIGKGGLREGLMALDGGELFFGVR